MANITITTDSKLAYVDFGNYTVSGDLDGKKATYLISDISIVWLEKNEDHVRVKMKDAINNPDWFLTYEYKDNISFIVDSINGVAPTSNQDLYDKLNAIR